MEENRIIPDRPEEKRTPVDKEIDRLTRSIEIDSERLAFLKANYAALKPLPSPAFSGNTLDFDNLPHAEVVKVVRAVGGKWKKEKCGDASVHYIAEKTIGGMQVRCYAAAPPPSCKIVEIEEHVPAVPAHVRKVKKMVCLPELGAVIAVAQEQAAKEQASPF